MLKPDSPFREKSAISIIKRDVAECNLPFRGDTYDGCYHNCIYCYARCGKFRDNWYTDNPRPVDIDALKKRFEQGFNFTGAGRKGDTYYVNRAIHRKFPIRLGTQTDCFQKCERKYRVTYEFMKYLVKHDYPFMINTKSDLIADNEYVDLLKKAGESVVVQFTITTLDPVIGKIETRAPSPQKRLDALKTLSEQGILTQIRYSPIIPKFDDDAEEVFRQAADCGATDVITEYLRLAPVANERFKKKVGIDLVEEVYRPNGCYDRGYYRLNHGYKYRGYKALEETANQLGLNFYVCSEEDPSINRCENCCGTDRYTSFDNHNTAAANNVYKLLQEKGEITLAEVKTRFWNIHWGEFEKRWNKGEVADFLVNTKVKMENKKELRDKEGNIIYVYEREQT